LPFGIRAFQFELNVRYAGQWIFSILLDIKLKEIPLALLAKVGEFAGITRNLLTQRCSDVRDFTTAGGQIGVGCIEFGCNILYFARDVSDFGVRILLYFRELG